MPEARDLELEKLHWQIADLKTRVQRPWLIGLAVPAAITAIAAAFGGYLFSDSLAARNRADIRKEVVAAYFGVDNDLLGKRRQILAFIESVVAKDDPDLAIWAKKEANFVDHRTREEFINKAILKERLRALEYRASLLQADSAQLAKQIEVERRLSQPDAREPDQPPAVIAPPRDGMPLE